MIKTLRPGFEPGGLVLFLIIMLPNIIWFLIPAPFDILRNASVTPVWDGMASVFQILLVVSLCALKNIRAPKRSFHSPFLWASVLLCLGYFLSWLLYYFGVAASAVPLLLCLFPCASFLFYSWDRKNGAALLAGIAFTLCHTMSTLFNFII